MWIGVAGMLRMKTPTQALHYLAVPGTVGMGALVLAIFLEIGAHAAAWKSVLIAIALLGINAVVAHATARAFRVRDEGSWQHRHGDDMEFDPR